MTAMYAPDMFTEELTMEAAVTAPPTLRAVPVPKPERSDSLLRVRVAPLVTGGDDFADFAAGEEDATETVMDMQLVVDYTSALAKRVAAVVKAGQVSRREEAHRHPEAASCLRCAILGTARDKTMGTTLLEILARANADEDWNLSADPIDPLNYVDGVEDPEYLFAKRNWDPSKACTDTKIISRLRRLAVSSQTMADIYGPNWRRVMLMCLRAEASSFELVHHLVQRSNASRILTTHTRFSLAAYHLALVTCPTKSLSGEDVPSMLRSSVAVRMAVTAAAVAEGEMPEWIDHLPAPVL